MRRVPMFTTAITCRPTRDSGVYHLVNCALDRLVPNSAPKSMVSLIDGFRASGKGSAASTVPTRMSIAKKSSGTGTSLRSGRCRQQHELGEVRLVEHDARRGLHARRCDAVDARGVTRDDVGRIVTPEHRLLEDRLPERVLLHRGLTRSEQVLLDLVE